MKINFSKKRLISINTSSSARFDSLARFYFYIVLINRILKLTSERLLEYFSTSSNVLISSNSTIQRLRRSNLYIIKFYILSNKIVN